MRVNNKLQSTTTTVRIKLVSPLSAVANTRYSRVSHSRQWSNYNLAYAGRMMRGKITQKCSSSRLPASAHQWYFFISGLHLLESKWLTLHRLYQKS